MGCNPARENFATSRFGEMEKLSSNGGGDNSDDQSDTEAIIDKLGHLVTESLGDDCNQLCDLLNEYLRTITEGYPLSQLPVVMQVLEFLSSRVKKNSEYRVYFCTMLDLCGERPLLEKFSDIANAEFLMRQLFLTLGHVLILSNIRQAAPKVLKALQALLSMDIKKPADRSDRLDSELCARAMESSELPKIASLLLEGSYPNVYPVALEIVSLLASVSELSCHRMLRAGLLNTLMLRMDFHFATESCCKAPPDSNRGESVQGYGRHTMFSIVNTLCHLVHSILLMDEPPKFLKDLSAPKRCAMWGLRCAFKTYARQGQYGNANKQLRNQIAVFILAGLIAFPAWDLVTCGLADDIFLLFHATEFGAPETWTASIRLDNSSNEDLAFKKIMLLTLARMARSEACIFVMRDRDIVPALLQLVNPNIRDIKIAWSVHQFWHVFEYAMYTLAEIVPKIPQRFIDHNGTMRLLLLVEWSLTIEFDARLVKNCVKTICLLIIANDPLLLQSLREYGMLLSLFRVVHRILDFDVITMQKQRIVILLLMAMEGLMKSESYLLQMYGERSIRAVMSLLLRCLNQKRQECKVDQRLLLAIGSYTWQCIVRCPVNLENFVECGAIYVLLDIIETSGYLVQVLFLGLLTDVCDATSSGPYLCTWRCCDKKKGLISMLCRIWKEEEIKVGVRRDLDHFSDDIELQQIGTQQRRDTYYSKLFFNHSPVLADMIGSVRTKIYSIRKIMQRDSEIYNRIREHYKILMEESPIEDQMTLIDVDLYLHLKIGQVWIEISKYLQQTGVHPLSMDGEVIFLMIQRHHRWGLYIEKRKKELLMKEKSAPILEERNEYARVRETKLMTSLEALREIKLIRRTIDRTFRQQEKNRHVEEVNRRLKYPLLVDAKHYHRTFKDNVDFTPVLGLHHTNRVNECANEPGFCEMEVPRCDSSRVSIDSLSVSFPERVLAEIWEKEERRNNRENL